MELLRAIDRIYTETPFYGYRKVHQQLIEGGYSVGLNRVRNYMNELGLKVIYPTKKVCTTLAHPEHKKYPYLLRDLEVYKPNQVWSTDITYIRLDGGFVYLAAVNKFAQNSIYHDFRTLIFRFAANIFCYRTANPHLLFTSQLLLVLFWSSHIGHF